MLLVVTALVGPAGGAIGPVTTSAGYVASRQATSGGFAEQGRQPDAGLTAWVALGLVAAGGFAEERAKALDYLRSLPGDTADESVLAKLRRHKPDVLVNETIWSVLALRAAGELPPQALVQGILAAQAKGGGFSWSRNGAADSNDTAAAIQALRAAGVSGTPIRRAVVALRGFQAASGGFSLTTGREPDAQSTAWAIQGLLAAGEKPGKPPFRFLAKLRRADGSYRYSARYATTPVWVTAQVLPALVGKPFPLG
jgi:hypothetical protein